MIKQTSLSWAWLCEVDRVKDIVDEGDSMTSLQGNVEDDDDDVTDDCDDAEEEMDGKDKW